MQIRLGEALVSLICCNNLYTNVLNNYIIAICTIEFKILFDKKK